MRLIGLAVILTLNLAPLAAGAQRVTGLPSQINLKGGHDESHLLALKRAMKQYKRRRTARRSSVTAAVRVYALTEGANSDLGRQQDKADEKKKGRGGLGNGSRSSPGEDELKIVIVKIAATEEILEPRRTSRCRDRSVGSEAPDARMYDIIDIAARRSVNQLSPVETPCARRTSGVRQRRCRRDRRADRCCKIRKDLDEPLRLSVLLKPRCSCEKASLAARGTRRCPRIQSAIRPSEASRTLTGEKASEAKR